MGCSCIGLYIRYQFYVDLHLANKIYSLTGNITLINVPINYIIETVGETGVSLVSDQDVHDLDLGLYV